MAAPLNGIQQKPPKANMEAQHRPIETHCPTCGSELAVEQTRRAWVRGLFDRSLWRPVMVCPECGTRSGGGRTVRSTHGHPSRNPVTQFLSKIKHRRQAAWLTDALRMREQFVDADGRLDLAKLLETAPFPVYGLKGRPLGLRLRSPGRGSSGSGDAAVIRITLGYVSGDPYDPEKAVEIEQGIAEQDAASQGLHRGGAHSDLSSIRSLIANYAPRKLRETDPFFRDFHRDWNIKLLEHTAWQQAALRVNGSDIEARFITWDVPHHVILARLELGSQSLSVAALNVSWDELREALSSLVVMADEPEVLAAHQQDFDEGRRLLMERNSHGPNSAGH